MLSTHPHTRLQNMLVWGEEQEVTSHHLILESLPPHGAGAVAAWPASHGTKGTAASPCVSTAIIVCVVLVITEFHAAHGLGVIGRASPKMPRQILRNGSGWSGPQSLWLWRPVSKETVSLCSYEFVLCYAVL